jgi:hypothetical protein
VLQEAARRAVEQRPAEPLAPADDLDHLPLLQRLEHAARADATDLLDLRPPDRLPVRDDRQRLERGGGEAGGVRHGVEALQHRRELRPRQQLVAAGDLRDIEGAALPGVLVPELRDRGLDLLLVQRLVRTGQLRGGERDVAREEQRLDQSARPHQASLDSGR